MLLPQRFDKLMDCVLQFHEQGIGLIESASASHRFQFTGQRYHSGCAEICDRSFQGMGGMLKQSAIPPINGGFDIMDQRSMAIQKEMNELMEEFPVSADVHQHLPSIERACTAACHDAWRGFSSRRNIWDAVLQIRWHHQLSL
jgi:hypothetical protein